jgi:hypothetical protein
MSAQSMIRYESPLEGDRLIADLTNFRQKLEADSDEPISELDLNVAMLLDDLCSFLGLSEEQRATVLGDTANAISHLMV